MVAVKKKGGGDLIVLGIDPGSITAGYGVIESTSKGPRVISFGTIEGEVKKSLPHRLCSIGKGVVEIINQYQPNCMVIEKTFFAKNADSASKLGHARGVLIYEGVKAGLELFEYTPTEIKQGITGSGRADKLQVRTCLQAFLGIPPINKFDASDALALALFHVLRADTAKKIKQREIFN